MDWLPYHIFEGAGLPILTSNLPQNSLILSLLQNSLILSLLQNSLILSLSQLAPE
jgi:hypothetical protein